MAHTYYIYGRKSHPQPLEYVDRVSLEDPSTLRHAVLQRVGESDWVELVAFPATAVIAVIPRDDEQ